MAAAVAPGIGLLLGSTAPVLAGGIERAPQSLGALFEPGNYAEVNFGRVKPDVSGTDVPIFGGRDTGGVAEDYGFVGFAYKQQLQDNLGALDVRLDADQLQRAHTGKFIGRGTPCRQRPRSGVCENTEAHRRQS